MNYPEECSVKCSGSLFTQPEHGTLKLNILNSHDLLTGRFDVFVNPVTVLFDKHFPCMY